MFPLANHLELRKVTIISLVTCIYLPIIITVISYKGLLYSVGQGSSFYILILIFIAELLKSFYLTPSSDAQAKRTKASKSRAGDILKSFVILLCVKFCFFLGIILFGAPVLDCHEETLTLSGLLTLLTVFPLIAHSGIESIMQLVFKVKRYSKESVVAMLVYNATMTVLGAWLGAVVIPLDWNAPWQKWPIPCYLGAIGGYLIANVYNIIYAPLTKFLNEYQSFYCMSFLLNRLEEVK